MRRREFIALAGASVTWPFAAMAQEPGRTYRLGFLYAAPRDAARVDTSSAFLDEVGRQGFIEGKNLAVDYRAFGSHPERVSEYAAELAKAGVDVIATVGPAATRAAQQATKTIPILAVTDDMLGEGLVNSMARPNSNTTGISILATELDGKRQEILIEAVSGIRRMAALADSNMTKTAAKLNALQGAARARGIELSLHQITTSEEIAAAIDMAKSSGAMAINVLASPLLWANRRLIMDRAEALRLPAIYEWPEGAEEGGFAGYGPRLIDIFRDIHARQLVQLLRGIKVADIPVQQPTKFELVINLKTANAMGVTVPEALLVRADKVIE
jgi:putative tryptophan/tyrosine transport system substrate-binding protein